MLHRRRLALAAVGVVGLLGACSRPTPGAAPLDTSPVEPSTTTETITPTSTAATTTSPMSTTTTLSGASTTGAPSTTSATVPPPTETPPATDSPATTGPPTPTSAADLTLGFDTIGPFAFGDPDVDVVPGLTAVLGAPTRDDTREYETFDDGYFLDAETDEAFVAPVGRTVCFGAGLCAQFASGAESALFLAGWTLEDDASSELATADGIALGSVLADFADVIEVDPLDSCEQVAFAAADGIDVTLSSDDGVFAAPNEDGSGMVVGDPDPAQVNVIGMSAGQLPFLVFADC